VICPPYPYPTHNEFEHFLLSGGEDSKNIGELEFLENGIKPLLIRNPNLGVNGYGTTVTPDWVERMAVV
jgi:hypothetical protein